MTLTLALGMYFGIGLAVFWLRRGQGYMPLDGLLAALVWPLDHVLHWLRAIQEINVRGYARLNSNVL